MAGLARVGAGRHGRGGYLVNEKVPAEFVRPSPSLRPGGETGSLGFAAPAYRARLAAPVRANRVDPPGAGIGARLMIEASTLAYDGSRPP